MRTALARRGVDLAYSAVKSESLHSELAYETSGVDWISRFGQAEI